MHSQHSTWFSSPTKDSGCWQLRLVQSALSQLVIYHDDTVMQIDL